VRMSRIVHTVRSFGERREILYRSGAMSASLVTAVHAGERGHLHALFFSPLKPLFEPIELVITDDLFSLQPPDHDARRNADLGGKCLN
jgi:hypothetical protein